MRRIPGQSGSQHKLSRRALLRHGARGMGVLGIGLFGGSVAVPVARAAGGGAGSFGPLQPPDANGLMLPPGFSSRIVAVTGQTVGSTSHPWHGLPDGGAIFPTSDGWIYASNDEGSGTSGGAGAIRFASDGSITDAYTILSGTNRNCAGGPTPWGTWLSCEEVQAGEVYECDPTTASQGVVRPALGTFSHEAAAVDRVHQRVYLTEDNGNGLLYRFTPSAYPDLTAGTLEAAEILDPGGDGPISPGEVRPLAWHAVPEPNPANGGVQNSSHLPVEERATRFQLEDPTPFARGEGCWYEGRRVYFATTSDSRVWCIDTDTDEISILYDLATTGTPELTEADNVYASPTGDVYVAEDGGNLQIVALTPGGAVKPVVQLTGVTGTEITGPAMTPDLWRLYFSSQRNPGVTYEVTGPFGTPVVPSMGIVSRSALVGALAALAALRLRTRRVPA